MTDPAETRPEAPPDGGKLQGIASFLGLSADADEAACLDALRSRFVRRGEHETALDKLRTTRVAILMEEAKIGAFDASNPY